MKALPAMLEGNPRPLCARIMAWINAWTKEDPDEPHWHLGPWRSCAPISGRGSALRC
jgi:hypothetical protein